MKNCDMLKIILRVKDLSKNEKIINHIAQYETIPIKYDHSKMWRCTMKTTEIKLTAQKKCCQKKTTMWRKMMYSMFEGNPGVQKIYMIEITYVNNNMYLIITCK